MQKIINLTGLTQTFSLQDKEFKVTLYPLSPMKLQSLTPQKILISATRFSELEDKTTRSTDEEKEYTELLSEFIKSNNSLIQDKLRAIITGEQAQELIDSVVSIGQEEVLLAHIEGLFADNEETKKK